MNSSDGFDFSQNLNVKSNLNINSYISRENVLNQPSKRDFAFSNSFNAEDLKQN